MNNNMPKYLILVLIAVAALGGGTLIAAKNATPGDITYPIRVAIIPNFFNVKGVTQMSADAAAQLAKKAALLTQQGQAQIELGNMDNAISLFLQAFEASQQAQIIVLASAPKNTETEILIKTLKDVNEKVLKALNQSKM